MRRLLGVVVLIASGALAGVEARGSGPADGLFKLVPPDAGATLAVENLRVRTREIGGSPLLASLRRLPMVQGWLRSDRFRQLERALADIEAAMGAPYSVIRDEVIGDAVVLVYQPGPALAPEMAKGLLLASPRDRVILLRLVETLNAAQHRAGDLIGLEKKIRGGLEYTVRVFKGGGRPSEYYTLFEDNTFAWSNSEPLIQGVIDRKLNSGPCLKTNPAFFGVRQGLPEKALASLFVDPRLVERMMAASPRPIEPGQERILAMLGRYLAAVGYAGLALEWRDGPVFHLREAINPARLDPWLKAWMAHPPSKSDLLDGVPDTALAVVSAHVDFEAVRAGLTDLVPEDERPRLENLRLVLQGFLLGEDPNTELLPRLSPHVLGYVETRPEIGVRPLFPMVGVMAWTDQPGAGELAAPIDNALRTFLALHAITPAQKPRHLRVESRRVGESRSTELTDGVRALLAYRVDRDRLAIGNATEAVARFGAGGPSTVIREVRKTYFPEVETYAVVDLIRLTRVVRMYRGFITPQLAARAGRPVGDLDRELGQWLALGDLFGAVSLTSTARADATAIHRTFALIGR